MASCCVLAFRDLGHVRNVCKNVRFGASVYKTSPLKDLWQALNIFVAFKKEGIQTLSVSNYLLKSPILVMLYGHFVGFWHYSKPPTKYIKY